MHDMPGMNEAKSNQPGLCGGTEKPRCNMSDAKEADPRQKEDCTDSGGPNKLLSRTGRKRPGHVKPRVGKGGPEHVVDLSRSKKPSSRESRVNGAEPVQAWLRANMKEPDSAKSGAKGNRAGRERPHAEKHNPNRASILGSDASPKRAKALTSVVNSSCKRSRADKDGPRHVRPLVGMERVKLGRIWRCHHQTRTSTGHH